MCIFFSLQKWIDDYIKWDPADYGEITHTVLPYKSIWMPEDIHLVNRYIHMRISSFLSSNNENTLLYTLKRLVESSSRNTFTVSKCFFPMDRYGMKFTKNLIKSSC